MLNARVLLVAAFGAMALSVSASFDLALVTDSSTNSVHRIDPINNVYLGAFGGGILTNPRGVVVNQNLGLAYVLDSTYRVSTWNYNTGAFISSYNTNIAGAKYLNGNSDGTLNVTGTTMARRINANGTTIATYNRSGTYDTQQGILLRDGRFYVSTRTGNNLALERFDYSTGAFLGTQAWNADRLIPIADTGGANTFNAYAFAGDVLLEFDNAQNGTAYVGSAVTSLIDTVAGVSPGHGSMMFVVGRDKATPTRGGIVRFDLNTSTVGPTMAGTSYIQTPTGMATVVAPEPATMLALGGGLMALLRRRRRG